MPWSHRMIHGPSGAGTRSKTTASSSPFQRIQERPVSMTYEEVMTETVTTCLLNPRATWQLSWERIATWGRPWRQCVQRGDVLIILPFSNWSRPRLHLGDVLITTDVRRATVHLDLRACHARRRVTSRYTRPQSLSSPTKNHGGRFAFPRRIRTLFPPGEGRSQRFFLFGPPRAQKLGGRPN